MGLPAVSSLVATLDVPTVALEMAAMHVTAVMLPVVTVRPVAKVPAPPMLTVVDGDVSMPVVSHIGEAADKNAQDMLGRIAFAVAASAGIAGTGRQQAHGDAQDDCAGQDELFPHLPSPYQLGRPTLAFVVAAAPGLDASGKEVPGNDRLVLRPLCDVDLLAFSSGPAKRTRRVLGEADKYIIACNFNVKILFIFAYNVFVISVYCVDIKRKKGFAGDVTLSNACIHVCTKNVIIRCKNDCIWRRIVVGFAHRSRIGGTSACASSTTTISTGNTST